MRHSVRASQVTQWWRICLQCRRHRRCGFSPWVGMIPWRRKWQPTPVYLSEKSHGKRSLVGYGPWGYKDLDMTEQLSMHITMLAVGYILASQSLLDSNHSQSLEMKWNEIKQWDMKTLQKKLFVILLNESQYNMVYFSMCTDLVPPFIP